MLALVAPAATADAAKSKPRLKRFDSCGQLVRYGNRHLRTYQPGGPPDQFTPVVLAPQGTAGPGGAEGAPAPAAEAPVADDKGSDFSLTNNQEAGVFEPDIVKTDGQLVYALSNGVLHVVADVRSEPREIATLALESPGYDDQMLLFKDRLLVTGSGPTGGTVLRLIDVGDPAKPTVLRTLEVNGALLAERRTESTVRVVLNAIPKAVAEPTATDLDAPRAWVPTGTFKRVATGRTHTSRLVRCKAVRRTKTFSGLESLTVLTIDMERGLDPIDTDAVMTSGDTVYASAKNLFVATHRYEPQLNERFSGEVPQQETTQIHRFSLDDAANTTYRGSGLVPGFVLNQFALSEAGDVLRVATTTTPPWFTEADQSQSYVTTLTETPGGLQRLGQIGGIGKGERIYAVRFLGDVGYVVTFRQTDPLFTIDLADPAAPRVRGELVLPGFSSYLHPIGNGKLIGIGQGPADDGTSNGVQLSLFDVSDLDAPKLEQRTTLVNGNSEAEYDHHAFLWWGPLDLAVLPATQYTSRGGGGDVQPSPPATPRDAIVPETDFNGAIGFVVRSAAITEAGRVTHSGSTVRRSLVIGDKLVTVSDGGLKTSALDGFADRGFVPFSGGGGTATPLRR
jgi:hypothetical protein